MDETKPCPYCGEPIQKVARKCKWCGEWLDEDSHSSITYITCPTCGEQIPQGSKTCPLCNEPITTSDNKPSTSPAQPTKRNKLPLYIAGGVVALALLGFGGVQLKSYLNNREYQETIENSPYSVISKNLDEAIAKGETLSQFLRDEKNVAALKSHFGDDVYSLILKLAVYSDEPLTSYDTDDQSAGGYAWRSPAEKEKYGCKLYLTDRGLGCKYYYEGFEVDQFGNIVTNPNWKRGYWQDEFNEDDMSKPYIEQSFEIDGGRKGYCTIRLDNINGVQFMLNDVIYYNQILLRNNDTDETWNLPIVKSGPLAVLKPEANQQFIQWVMTSKSGLKLSAIDSSGQYTPSTVTLEQDKMDFPATFKALVEGKRINSDIFISNGLN